MSESSRGPLVEEIAARISAGELDEAIAAVIARIRAEPERAAALHALAEHELETGSFEVGELIIEALVQQAPNAERLSDLGAIKHVKGEHTLAETLLLEALSFEPSHQLALLNIAALYLDCGRVGDAMRACGSLVQAIVQTTRAGEADQAVSAELLFQLAERLAPVAPDQADRVAAVAVGRLDVDAPPRQVKLVVPAPQRERAARDAQPRPQSDAVFSIGGGAAS
ncbi:MAG: hypothetical protein KC503_29180 [Myxococcales bacterium]|nr:hypothetical protein [Myxococcales bacterium]